MTVTILANSQLNWPYSQEVDSAASATPLHSRVRGKSIMRASGDFSHLASMTGGPMTPSTAQTAPFSQAILKEGEVLSKSVVLPSIMQADYEMIGEYCNNLLHNLVVEYDENTWSLELVLK